MRVVFIIQLICSIVLFSCNGSRDTIDSFRPKYHFTPEYGWMNDPNGMVRIYDEFHLFYQYYPDSLVWGPMHWGHAVSKDLVNWERLPIALYPDSLGYIFSGSAVVDYENTTGFGSLENPAVVAMFTHHNPKGEKNGSIDFQCQSLAFSLDTGKTWKKYTGNPVLQNPGIRDFRDPKVFWYDADQRWRMILAVKDQVFIYSSPNLKSWQLESKFGKENGAKDGVWECPDLFPLVIKGEQPITKWVMLVSINPGGPQGGSATQYFIGDFDGSVFTPQDDITRWVDYGADNYAGVTFNQVSKYDKRKIFIGWMSNWQYAQEVPSESFRSAMTFPRELLLRQEQGEFVLISKPISELALLHPTLRPIYPNRIDSVAMYLELNDFTNEFVLEIMNDSTLEKVMIELTLDSIKIDRREAGISDFNRDFAVIHAAPLLNKENSSIRILLDRTSIELFVDHGEVVMTDLLFPRAPYNKYYIRSGKIKNFMAAPIFESIR